MLKVIKDSAFAGMLFVGLSTTAEAALINGGSLIYDTDLDITWLADANYALTSGYIDSVTTKWGDGRMTWQQADTWVNQLDFAGFTEWRLPIGVAIADDPSCVLSDAYPGDTNTYAYGCTGSEMGHLFEELGGVYDIVANSATFDETIFDNLLHKNYWSGTLACADCTANGSNNMYWDFDFKNSVTEDYGELLNFYALAVHEGDIGNLAPIPVPPAVWLFGSGLIGLISVSRRKK